VLAIGGDVDVLDADGPDGPAAGCVVVLRDVQIRRRVEGAGGGIERGQAAVGHAAHGGEDAADDEAIAMSRNRIDRGVDLRSVEAGDLGPGLGVEQRDPARRGAADAGEATHGIHGAGRGPGEHVEDLPIGLRVEAHGECAANLVEGRQIVPGLAADRGKGASDDHGRADFGDPLDRAVIDGGSGGRGHRGHDPTVFRCGLGRSDSHHQRQHEEQRLERDAVFH